MLNFFTIDWVKPVHLPAPEIAICGSMNLVRTSVNGTKSSGSGSNLTRKSSLGWEKTSSAGKSWKFGEPNFWKSPSEKSLLDPRRDGSNPLWLDPRFGGSNPLLLDPRFGGSNPLLGPNPREGPPIVKSLLKPLLGPNPR